MPLASNFSDPEEVEPIEPEWHERPRDTIVQRNRCLGRSQSDVNHCGGSSGLSSRVLLKVSSRKVDVLLASTSLEATS